MKAHAPSSERNRASILSVLQEVFKRSGLVVEIGSGTGQHAAWFARELPQLTWQPTDLSENQVSIEAWRTEVSVSNLMSPRVLDIFSESWPVTQANYVVCINTIHIVSWTGVEKMIQGVGKLLTAGGIFYVYGPYRYSRRPLEPSNEQFDEWLRGRDPNSGIRDFEAVNDLAEGAGMQLLGDREMPANNRSIWWVKQQAPSPAPSR